MKTKSKRTSNIRRSDAELLENAVGTNVVPIEIDTHFQMYGKHVWEVEYGERCPLCNKTIDEYGFCACGSGGQ